MEDPPELGRALAAANSGIVIADATREGFPLTFVNTAFERLTGFARAEVVGRNCRFLQGPDTEPEAIAEIASALRERRETTVVLRNFRRDGTLFYNELRLAPVFAPDGTYSQVIGVQNDVTPLVRAQRSLERASRTIARQDHELAELRVLQRALTPAEPPVRPRLELATSFLPAEDGVAGDFYLVAPGPRETTVVIVGDVIGHGLEAARRATFIRTALSTFTRFTDDPVRLLEMANHVLLERAGATTDFVTALCVAHRPEEQRLAWASAGHPGPVALDTGEPAEGGGGLPLGLDIDLGASCHGLPFPPEAGVLLFTDGLPEAKGPVDRFGDERVRDAVRALRGARPPAVVEALRAQATAHARGRFADDLCIIAARAT